jgi:sulfur carrier protein ThiS
MSVTEFPELRIELGPAAEAIERANRRLADLLATVDEPDRGVRGLEWTLGELVAHLAARSGRFAAYLSGAALPEGVIAGIAEENRRDVHERRERPIADLVEELRSNVSSFVATTHG